MSREAYFLTLRLPLVFLGGESLDEFDDPKPSHEERSYAFYEVDHPILADRLIDLFKASEGEGGLASIFDIVGHVDWSQAVLYREAVQSLDRLASPDPDPGTMDRRTMFLVGYHRQAHEWEPLVRDELANDIYPPQPLPPPPAKLTLDDAIEDMLAPKDETPGEARLRRSIAEWRKRDERVAAGEVRPEDEEDERRELGLHAQAEAILREEEKERDHVAKWREKIWLAERAKVGLPPLEDVKAGEAVSPFPWGRVILLAVLLLVLESGAIASACYWGEGENALQKIGACWWLLTSVFAIIGLVAPFTLGKATWVRVKRWWNSARGEAQ